jgi:uncharacterized membrane protein
MTNFISLLRKSIFGLDRYPAFLLVTWLVVIVSLPLVRKELGEQVFLEGLVLMVLIQVLFVCQALLRAWGWWPTLRTAVGVVFFAWVAEAVGIRSGLPFGQYHYTSLLHLQVMGVPVLIPLAWLMMLPPAWAVAKMITQKATGHLMHLTFILVSALAFTSWDFFLDPQMVRWGLWAWDQPGGYFGVPWINFLGWLLISALITALVNPRNLSTGLLVLVYGLTWLVEFICQLFFWGLPGSAVVGFCLMGGILLWAGIASREDKMVRESIELIK